MKKMIKLLSICLLATGVAQANVITIDDAHAGRAADTDLNGFGDDVNLNFPLDVGTFIAGSNTHPVFVFQMTGVAAPANISKANFSVSMSLNGSPDWDVDAHVIRKDASRDIREGDYQTSTQLLMSGFNEPVDSAGTVALDTAGQLTLGAWLRNNWVEGEYVFIGLQSNPVILATPVSNTAYRYGSNTSGWTAGKTDARLTLDVIPGSGTTSQPNIIFILCDDLAYGDIGVIFQNGRAAGLPRQTTPNLDAFANQGLQLDPHYSGATVCAPARSSLLEGVHQGHANVRDEDWRGAIADNHTLATVLKTAGYATAAIGKWGLPGSDSNVSTTWSFPMDRGFDYFLGQMRHVDGHAHYPKENNRWTYEGRTEIRNILDKSYSTDLFTARAKKWIVDHRIQSPQQPFFLYLAYTAPHAAYQLPTQAYPAGGGLTGGLQWLGTPTEMINTANGTVDSYIDPDIAAATYDHDGNPGTAEVPWPEIFQRYAMMVRRIDDSIGDLTQLLQDLDIDENTLVIFTSDNGPTQENYTQFPGQGGYRPDFFETYGPLDGIKRDLWEGGIRVPTLVRWPGTVAAGTVSNTPSQFHDWMPTLTEVAGLPGPARSDGVSLVPTLTGEGTRRPSIVYSEFKDNFSTPEYAAFEPDRQGRVHGQMQVVGLNGYQGVRYETSSITDDFEIYEVINDPKQTTNLAGDPAFAALQQQMKDHVLRLRRPHAKAPRPYDNALVPNIVTAPIENGVEWREYAERFPWVPELTELDATADGSANAPTLAVRSQNDDIGLLFTGYINAPVDGDYTLYLSADTGAFLRIHEAIVIDADFGYVGGTELSGSIRLKAGLHPFRLYYARATAGTPALNFSWSGPGIAKQPIPATAYFRDVSTGPIPIAQDDFATTSQGVPVLVDVLANDSDDGLPLPLFITEVGAPRAGSAVIDSGRILYSPDSNFLGRDHFTYTISDGENSASANVDVEVTFSDGNYWFPFNQTSGLTTEEAGGGTTASLLGFTNDPAQWVAGPFNRALQFDGVDDRVVINGFKGIVGTNPRTVTAWVKSSVTNRSIGIVSWGALPSEEKWSLLLQNTTEPMGTLRLELGTGNTIGSTPINDGQWHHIACTLENLSLPNSTDVKFYVNGQLDPVIGGTSVGINTASINDALIGTDIQNRYFEGTIDEVRIYNRALSAEEIAELYTATNQSAAAWHRRYFGNAPIDWTVDDNGNGVSRFGEYVFGGQPLIPNAQAMRVFPQIVNDHMEIQFRRRIAGTTEANYQVKSSIDLVNWGALDGSEISVVPSATHPGFEDVIFRADQAASDPPGNLFIRMEAQLPE